MKILQFVSLCILLNILILVNSNDNTGFTKVIVEGFVMCKWPKTKDCFVSTAHININNKVDLDVNITENVTLNKGKIVGLLSDNTPVRLTMDRPCDNMFVKSFLKNLFNVDKHCIVQKGRYTMNVDVEERVKAFIVGRQLVGRQSIKLSVYTNDCNVFCSDLSINCV